jgi:hypothetical protein
MVERVREKKRHSALKHGGYSTIGLLPGESPAEFDKLHKDLVEELAPVGPLEHDVVLTVARLIWRKQNLSTFRTAELARERRIQIIEEELARREIPDSPFREPTYEGEDEYLAAREEAEEAAEKQARAELGYRYEFTENDLATEDRLMADLALEDRLDSAIDKCMKRLLMLRGVKSITAVPPSQFAQLPKPRSTDRSAA